MGERARYWSLVGRRAWREAVASSPWSSPMRILSTLAGFGLSGGAGYAATQKFSMAGLWAIIGAGLVIVLGALWRLITVPADMNAEAEARDEASATVLASYESQKPDTELEDAVSFLMRGNWSEPVHQDNIQLVSEALHWLRQRAFSKSIVVWGKRTEWGIEVPVPNEIWEFKGVDLATYFDASVPVQTERIHGPIETDRYMQLRVSRAQIEREWTNQLKGSRPSP